MVVYEKYNENNIHVLILKRCYKINLFKTLMRLINTAKKQSQITKSMTFGPTNKNRITSTHDSKRIHFCTLVHLLSSLFFY